MTMGPAIYLTAFFEDNMIGFVKGSIEYVGDGFVVAENNGIGYNINVSSQTALTLSVKEGEVKIYTYTSVKEDDITLFGFLTRQELDLFKLLISVNGVGPKSALGILGSSDINALTLAVMTEDVNTLAKAPGIGKKTAQRIALELKDKLKGYTGLTAPVSVPSSVSLTKTEAVQALQTLGFTAGESEKAVSSIYDEKLTTEELVQRALRALN